MKHIDVGGLAVVGLAGFVVYQLAKQKQSAGASPSRLTTIYPIVYGKDAPAAPVPQGAASVRDNGIDYGSTIYDDPGIVPIVSPDVGAI